ncbi:MULTISPECIES: NUDIX hydrolase [Streptomyces]|uniref:Nudix hydrolase domain-containing protein n=1 Tax=Streptomyces luteosporeus TaxID=173856 RepID=A0ABN3TWV0_9ACTN
MGKRQMPLPVDEYIKTLPSLTGCAGVLFTDTADRPLMLHSIYEGYSWQLPGGMVDHGEDLRSAAQREAQEETGLQAHGPMNLLLLEFWHPIPNWPGARVMAVFDGGVLSAPDLANVELAPDEHDAFACRTWDEWIDLATPAHRRMLPALREARRTGVPGYLVFDAPAGA